MHSGTPDLRAALEKSLDEGCRVYLRYLWEQRKTLAVLHPWVEDACREVGIIVNSTPLTK